MHVINVTGTIYDIKLSTDKTEYLGLLQFFSTSERDQKNLYTIDCSIPKAQGDNLDISSFEDKHVLIEGFLFAIKHEGEPVYLHVNIQDIQEVPNTVYKNTVNLIGIVAGETGSRQSVEVRYFESGAIKANFRLQVRHWAPNKQVSPSYFNIEGWNRLAETMAKYLPGGKRIGIYGSLTVSNYRNSLGQNSTYVGIKVNPINGLTLLDQTGQQGEFYTSQGGPRNKPINDIEEDEEIPFS